MCHLLNRIKKIHEGTIALQVALLILSLLKNCKRGLSGRNSYESVYMLQINCKKCTYLCSDSKNGFRSSLSL